MKAWDVDFYLSRFYKIFGPYMGCLFGKKDLLIGAMSQGHYFFNDDDITHKLNPVGLQHEMIASLAGITEYLDALAEHYLSNPANDPQTRIAAVFDIMRNIKVRWLKNFSIT